jgi:hypothetical protein
MANDLVPHDDDGFGVPEPRTGFIIGAMVKFVDRDFIADKTEKLPEGITLVCLSTVTAWVKWAEGKPAEHRVTRAGQGHPRREDLPDQDQNKWEIDQKFTGKPQDPWHDSRYVHMICPKTGRDFTFVTDTYGGRAAVGDLKTAITNVRRARPGAVPMVRYAWKMMQTNYGPRPRPLFDIVEWRDGGPTTNQPEPMKIEGPRAGGSSMAKKLEPAGGGAPFDDDVPFAPERR